MVVMATLWFVILSYLVRMLFWSFVEFFKINFFENSFIRNTIRVSNSLIQIRPDGNVVPDLGLKCLQRLSADDTSRQRVEPYFASNVFKFSQVTVLSHKCCYTKRYRKVTILGILALNINK